MKPPLTAAEVAKVLEIAVPTLNDLVAAKKLRILYRGGRSGRKRFFNAAEVEALRQERIRNPPTRGFRTRGRL